MPQFRRLANGEWEILTVTPSGEEVYVSVSSIDPQVGEFFRLNYFEYKEVDGQGQFFNEHGTLKAGTAEAAIRRAGGREAAPAAPETPDPVTDEPTTKTFTVLDALGGEIEVEVALEDVDEFGNAHKVYVDKDGIPLWIDTIRVDGQFQRTMLRTPEARPDPATVGRFDPVEGLPGFGIVTLPDGTPRLVETPVEEEAPEDVGRAVPIEGLPGFGLLTLPDGRTQVVDIAAAEARAAEADVGDAFSPGVPFPIGDTGMSFVRLPDGEYALLPERDVPSLPEQQAQAFLDGDLDKVRQITGILSQPRTMEQLVTSMFASGNDARAKELLGIMNAPTQREVFGAIASKFKTAFGVAQFASVFGMAAGKGLETAMAQAALGDLGIGVKEAVAAEAPEIVKEAEEEPIKVREKMAEKQGISPEERRASTKRAIEAMRKGVPAEEAAVTGFTPTAETDEFATLEAGVQRRETPQPTVTPVRPSRTTPAGTPPTIARETTTTGIIPSSELLGPGGRLAGLSREEGARLLSQGFGPEDRPGPAPRIPEGPGGSALTVPAAPLGAVQADLTRIGRSLTGREIDPFSPAKLFEEAGMKFGVAGKFRAPSQSQLAKLSPRERDLLTDKLSAIGISGREFETAVASATPGSFNRRSPRARIAPRGIR